MAFTITPDAVVSEWGSYYINEGQNENNIHDTLRETFQSQEIFTVIESEDTILREANVQYAEALQAFQTGFTPKGGVTFTPKEIPLFNVKADIKFVPDVLKQSWLQFLLSENLDRTTWPFTRWIIEVYLMKQIMHDLEKNIYPAVYSAPTAGTAGAANAAFNGIKKAINDAITAGTIVPIVTGAPSTTEATWAGQVETFCKGIPELYWNTPMTLNMSRALALRYKQGRRTKYNSNYTQVSDAMAVQDYEQISVAGFGSLTGQTKIFGTPKANAILAFKGGGNKQVVDVQKEDRFVKVFTDFWIGVGFIQDSLVFTNDRELPA